MTQTKGDATRERILAAAMELIHTQGYHHTHISDIMAASGVKKGNLYFHFASKDDLCLALLRKAKEDYFAYLRKSMKSAAALDRLNDIFMAVYKLHRSRRFMGGCLFGNIALEMSDENPLFADIIRDVFDEWSGLFAELIEQAQAEGRLEKDIRPASLARHIVASLEGAIMMTKLTKDQDDFIGCIRTLQDMLKIEPGHFEKKKKHGD